MPQRRTHVSPTAAQSELARSLAALREEVDAPTEFAPEVLAEAEAATATEPALDLRDVPFATLDPAGSKDLDQAFHLERAGSGFQVRYAIADVPGFVAPGGLVDHAARERGQTLYAADGSIPLHPRVLSEDRVSLLPDVDRPALVWTFRLDDAGAVSEFRLERALIRSRAQLEYVAAQAAVDRGEDGPWSLLPVVGALRQDQERLRGGASLNLPDSEVVQQDDGTYTIERRHPLPIEDWNAQLSLMTGMAAAELMIDAKIGVLRTMPDPDERAFASFRRKTKALGRPWTEGTYGDYLRSLDRADPLTLPVLDVATSLFRGAGYAVFDGTVPDERTQSAIAAPYAHTTAPLRRLVDRWALAICLAVSQDAEVPSWVRESLAELPPLMQSSGQIASRLNADTVNRVEAALLAPRVGGRMEASVIELRDNGRAEIQIADPAVTATSSVKPGTEPGDAVTVRLVRADIGAGLLEFEGV